MSALLPHAWSERTDSASGAASGSSKRAGMKPSSQGGTLTSHDGLEANVTDPLTAAPELATPDRGGFALPGDAGGSERGDATLVRSDLAGAFALLAKMTQDFAVSMDIVTTLESALAMIAAHLDAEAGSLWLVESSGDEITCHACVGPHPITGLHLPISEGIVGRSVRENLCQRVLDVRCGSPTARSARSR